MSTTTTSPPSTDSPGTRFTYSATSPMPYSELFAIKLLVAYTFPPADITTLLTPLFWNTASALSTGDPALDEVMLPPPATTLNANPALPAALVTYEVIVPVAAVSENRMPRPA